MSSSCRWREWHDDDRGGRSDRLGNQSSFREIVTEHLRNDGALLIWFRFATAQKSPLVRDWNADRLFVFAAAERALEHGDNPPALFADVIKNNRRGYITQAQEDRALKRLRKLDNRGRDDRMQREESTSEQTSDALTLADILNSRGGNR